MSHLKTTFIDRLDRLEEVELPELQAALFAASHLDTLQQMKSWVDTIDPEDIFEMNRDNRVDDVQPTNFVLFSRPGRYEILINHFVTKLFERSRNAPHFHHCNFVTRILHGGYVHVVYDNVGTLHEPDLAVQNTYWVGPGQGYPISWKTYHTILKPIDGTLSLLVRGPQCSPRPNLSNKPYSLETFATAFASMKQGLTKTTSEFPSHVTA